MPSPAESKYLNRVRALLAKAEATEFPAEAEKCTALAVKLMAKYGNDAAHLRRQHPKAEPIHERVTITSPRAKARGHLLDGVARGRNCEMLLERKKGSMTGIAHLFGFPDDIERVKLVYASLLLQLESSLKRIEVPIGESPKAFRNAWAMGYARRISDRMEKAKKTFTTEASGADSSFALVLADQSRAVEARMRQEFPTYRNFRTYSSSRAGKEAGYAAGDSADIGHARVSGRRAIES